MTKRPTLFLAAALALPALAGGCSGTQNRGLESVHQPVVARADYALDLNADAGGLSRGESGRLAGWADSIRLGYGDRVAIDDPAGSPRTRQMVASIVAAHGLLLADEAPPVGQPVAPGTVRIVVSRLKASTPGCPDWSRDSSSDFNQNTSSNFGCATNANLAAVVANPGDLVRGQSGGGVNDPVSSYRAVDAYRQAKTTGGGGTIIKTDTATGGK